MFHTNYEGGNIKMSEYDHKKSTKVVGQLYPVLLAKDGKVIDGIHRLDADPSWKTLRIEGIDTEEKLLISRCVANWHRRQVPREEKEKWINGLARIYKGLLKEGASLRDKIAQVTGLTPHTIGEYLYDKYKLRVVEKKKQPPRISASQRIEHDLGKDYVERHREEVREELKSDEFFKEEVKAELRQEVKDDLFSDEKLLIEAISRTPEIVTKAPKSVIDEIGRHIPTITKEQTERAVEALEKSKRELEEIRALPETKERGKLVKNWMAHTDLVGLAESLRCPVCGSGAKSLVWKCHPEMNVFEAQKRTKKKLEED